MKSTRSFAVRVMMLLVFCFLTTTYASDPQFIIFEGTFADSTGAFTLEVPVTNNGQTGSIDGFVKKAHNVLPQPTIAPETLTLTRGESGSFTVRGTLKNPSLAGSVDLKFNYVSDDTGKKATLKVDALITPGS